MRPSEGDSERPERSVYDITRDHNFQNGENGRKRARVESESYDESGDSEEECTSKMDYLARMKKWKVDVVAKENLGRGEE